MPTNNPRTSSFEDTDIVSALGNRQRLEDLRLRIIEHVLRIAGAYTHGGKVPPAETTAEVCGGLMVCQVRGSMVLTIARKKRVSENGKYRVVPADILRDSKNQFAPFRACQLMKYLRMRTVLTSTALSRKYGGGESGIESAAVENPEDDVETRDHAERIRHALTPDEFWVWRMESEGCRQDVIGEAIGCSRRRVQAIGQRVREKLEAHRHA
ncbi:MAG: hypothetical protein KF745_12880 [Phycisphaeraceae bacterium]|nr:hypothetical protein [Phycisphaeraceae bacterium]